MNINRHFSCILLIFFTFQALSPVSAQIRLAALGGIHSSDFIQQNSIPAYQLLNGQYYSPKTAFELGVMAEIPFGKHHLFFQPGMLYSAKGNQFERFYDSSIIHSDTLYNQHTLNLNYVEMPFYLTWKAPLSKNGKTQFYLSAGPYFAFIMGATQTYQNRIKQFNSDKYLYQSGTEDLPVGNSEGQYKTFDIGLTAKAGFELGNVLIGAYFSRGFTNAYTASYPSSFHNQVFGGSLGIWLNKYKPAEMPATDQDQDGTPDPDDSCKTISGPPRWHGCPVPDFDHDGINDEEDSCRTLPGQQRYHGCPVPDSDHDGIDDESDSCRNVPGLAKYHGCPVPDSDLDGLNDEQDKCPTQAGPVENQGCPVVHVSIKQRAVLVAANITFNTNSDRLTARSAVAIKELADSLRANPDLDLLIEGHTDNIGDPGYNMKLSSERAESVKSALVQEGVNANRITTKGYGDSKPVENNKTQAGRAANRRVVFDFELKKR